MVKIFPSLTSANILDIKNAIETLEPYCDGFHIDVMDGHFVPNLTFGPAVVNALAKIVSKQLFVHLMVENPERLAEYLQLPDDSLVVFHKTTTPKPSNVIKMLEKKGWKTGIALDPDEQVESILPLLPELDEVLIMSVRPGFTGQEFIPQVLEKVKELAKQRKKQKLNFKIALDGGINEDNMQEIIKTGVDNLVIASAIFKTKDPLKELKNLKKLTKS
jgi:ribulose-phosphate 3-epimerase